MKISCRSAAIHSLLLVSLAPLGLAGCGSSAPSDDAPPPIAPRVAPAPKAGVAGRAIPAGRTGPAQPAADATAGTDWQTAVRGNTEWAYLQFAKRHAADPRAAAAKATAGRLDWQHAEKAGTDSAYRQYLSNYSTAAHAAEARKVLAAENVSLADAARRGWVGVTVSGNGLQSVELVVTRKVNRPLRVSLPTGTYFVSGGGAQNMVATGSGNIADLTYDKSSDLTVGAACANFYRAQPDQSNRFHVRAEHPNPELRKVLAVIGKRNSPSIVKQLAVWSITDNPSRDEVEGHIMPSPEADDFQQAAGLLRQAGIQPSTKRMFRHID